MKGKFLNILVTLFNKMCSVPHRHGIFMLTLYLFIRLKAYLLFITTVYKKVTCTFF